MSWAPSLRATFLGASWTALILIFMAASGSKALAQESAPKPVAKPAASARPIQGGLKIPAWLEQVKLKAVTGPFEQAFGQGGKFMQGLPRAVGREFAGAQAGRAVAVRAFAVAAMPVNGQAAPNEQMEQQIKALIPQYRPQFLHILHSELQSARGSCEIPKEKRAEIYTQAEAAFENGLEKYIRQMYMPVAGERRGSAMRSAVRTSLEESLKTRVPPAEFSKFEAATRERAALRKQVCIDCVVVRLDDLARLTKEQREKITKSISDNWSDDWESWLMLWQYDDPYMPVIDDALIVSHLTAQQRRIWQQAQKIGLSGEMHSEFAQAFDESFWEVKKKDEKGGQQPPLQIIELIQDAR